MTDNTFGFPDAKASLSQRLKSFQPTGSVLQPRDGDLSKTDAAGERVGFKSREPTLSEDVVHRRKKNLGPTTALNMRAPQRVAVPFIKFCEENRFSYWEGIEELMQRAGTLGPVGHGSH